MSSPDSSQRRRDLREFLQARRATLKPEEFGFQGVRRRRALGLRREEVASLAGVGLTWYTWLEQGRDIRVSEDMLQRLAGALRLSPHDTTYLFSLAGHHPPEIRSSVFEVDAGVQLALDGFTVGPAFVLNARIDAVAFNRLADVLYRFDDHEGPLARNMVWRLFMDPSRRRLYRDWATFAAFGVGFLRGNYATRSGDPDFESLIQALRASSAEFDRLWSDSRRRGASSLAPAQVRFRVPRVGDLTFVSVRLALPSHPDHMMVLLPPADRTAERAMAALAASLLREPPLRGRRRGRTP